MPVYTQYRPEEFARLSASQRAQTLKDLWKAVFNHGHGANGGPFTMREFMNAVGNRLSPMDRNTFSRQAWSQLNDPYTAYVLLCTVAQGFGIR